MRCGRCDRDLRKYGYPGGGNMLDGYVTQTNLCKDCSRKTLRERGLGQLATKDENFYTGLRVADWALAIFFAVIALIAFYGAVFVGG